MKGKIFKIIGCFGLVLSCFSFAFLPVYADTSTYEDNSYWYSDFDNLMYTNAQKPVFTSSYQALNNVNHAVIWDSTKSNFKILYYGQIDKTSYDAINGDVNNKSVLYNIHQLSVDGIFNSLPTGRCYTVSFLESGSTHESQSFIYAWYYLADTKGFAYVPYNYSSVVANFTYYSIDSNISTILASIYYGHPYNFVVSGQNPNYYYTFDSSTKNVLSVASVASSSHNFIAIPRSQDTTKLGTVINSQGFSHESGSFGTPDPASTPTPVPTPTATPISGGSDTGGSTGGSTDSGSSTGGSTGGGSSASGGSAGASAVASAASNVDNSGNITINNNNELTDNSKQEVNNAISQINQAAGKDQGGNSFTDMLLHIGEILVVVKTVPTIISALFAFAPAWALTLVGVGIAMVITVIVIRVFKGIF